MALPGAEVTGHVRDKELVSQTPVAYQAGRARALVEAAYEGGCTAA
jgi:hypothetical protein